MPVECWSVLRAGVRHATRAVHHHRHRVGHSGAHAHHVPAGHSLVTPTLQCRDTDAPFRALRHPFGSGPAAPGRTAGALAKAGAQAGSLFVGSTLAGAGAGYGYRTITGASSAAALPTPSGSLSRADSLGAAGGPAGLLSPAGPFGLAALGPGVGLPTGNFPGTTPSLELPAGTPNLTPAEVAEPSSVLILAVGLIAVALTRWSRLRHRHQ